MIRISLKEESAVWNVYTGGAWLSSARVVRCWVSPATSATLIFSCLFGTLKRLPVINRRKAGMTSSQHAPYTLGYTRATMGETMRCDSAKIS